MAVTLHPLNGSRLILVCIWNMRAGELLGDLFLLPD